MILNRHARLMSSCPGLTGLCISRKNRTAHESLLPGALPVKRGNIKLLTFLVESPSTEIILNNVNHCEASGDPHKLTGDKVT